MNKKEWQQIQEAPLDRLFTMREEAKKELFQFRLQHATNQLKQTHVLRQSRKTIAKINTLITAKRSTVHTTVS